MGTDIPCRLCGGTPTEAVGSKTGHWDHHPYALRHCPSCRFSFVEEPRTDYEAVYGEDYYNGRGADPAVDYVYELEAPDQTIRNYEWRGILNIVRSLVPVTNSTRWLDYGCGNGGLVRYCRQETGCQIVGFEEGWIRKPVEQAGTPLLDPDEIAAEGDFEVVTMIEVIEHVPDPVATLRDVRRLLRPGGLLFMTTGNAKPFRGRLPQWRYVVPEVHISFFEPDALALALTKAGFRPEFRGFLPGFSDVIRFKILKSLGRRHRSPLEAGLPWPVISRLTDRKFGVTAQPIGWAV